jgi:hypothetical protein
MKPPNILGQRFGRLVVLERKGSDIFSKALWECKCDCGKTTQTTTSLLRSGKTKSCGCLVIDSGKARATHGMSRTNDYAIWAGMLDRCYNDKSASYPRYGGRGITVCDAWRESFETFHKDMGPRPSINHSIDRRKNNEGYHPDNCHWTTPIEQSNNRERTLFFEKDGETKSLMQWCTQLNLKYSLIYHRIKVLGWAFHEAIQPIEHLSITYQGDTMILKDWCDLLDLKYNVTYLRILRGDCFDDIVAE